MTAIASESRERYVEHSKLLSEGPANSLLQAFEPDDIALHELKRAFEEGKAPMALVGAGVSVGSGYPSWTGLIQLMDQALQERAPKWRLALQTLGDPLWQAEEYRTALGEKEFADLIASTFAPKSVREPHLTLARLPFRHFLTTNFDPSIEYALRARGVRKPRWIRWEEGEKLCTFLRSLSDPHAPQCVVYLHGRFNRPRATVLTESGYVRRYVRDEDARRKLLAIFITHPVVFVGFSMDDPDLAQLMREVATRISGGASHYAIMGYRTEDEREAIRRRMSGKFGVNVIGYRVVDNDHGALLRLLQWLEDPKTRPSASPAHLSNQAALPQDSAGINGTTAIDPQKGRWGGAASAGGITLDVELIRETGEWATFVLVVRKLDRTAKLEGRVTFHLHPTFPRQSVEVAVEDGRAVLERSAYGAFTIGAEVPSAGVTLELDLATAANMPAWFRAR